jgi:hypothetical protein
MVAPGPIFSARIARHHPDHKIQIARRLPAGSPEGFERASGGVQVGCVVPALESGSHSFVDQSQIFPHRILWAWTVRQHTPASLIFCDKV